MESLISVKTTALYKMLHAAFFIFLLISTTGCIKNDCILTRKYKAFVPVYMTLDDLRKSVKSISATDLVSPGKIYYKDQYIFVNEPDKGIHVIDNHNPSSPVNIAFINIPGNIDLAIKGNILYADSYMDMVAIDISNPLNVIETGRVVNVFPNRIYNGGFVAHETKGVVVDWIERDTTVKIDCSGGYNGPMIFENQYDGMVLYSADQYGSGSNTSPSTSSPGNGLQGSTARFCLYSNFLYALNNTQLLLFNISSPLLPVSAGNINLSWNIETIWPWQDKLFIGSTNGVFIFDNSNPANPVQISQFVHATSCDPVVVEGNYAYSTLRSGNACSGFSNQLDIIDVTDLYHPHIVASFGMTNPYGLGIDDSTLFICDNTAGLKVYNVQNPVSIELMENITGIIPFDVIPVNNVLITVASDGIYQYDYSDASNLQLLSKIPVVEIQ